MAKWSKFKLFVTAFTLATFVFGGACAGLIVAYLNEIPLVSDLKDYKPSLSTRLFDVNGNLITQLYLEQRTLVPLDKIPANMQNAIIAIEDNHFYTHWGIDVSGILRAITMDLAHKGYVQGASTITQQLARNLFLTHERKLSRKIKEAILAVQIERAYTKKEILEMYLNQIYFGNGAYGVESAARTYFGKHAEELDLSECATLAGIPRSPNENNPVHDVVKATRRRDTVLAAMVREGFLSEAEGDATRSQPITVKRMEVANAPYFVEYIRQQLEAQYGSNAIYKGGLSVYTTLDLHLQDLAQRAITEGLAKADAKAEAYLTYFFRQGEKPSLQGAMVVMDPKTGAIRAMVGGKDFNKSEFNHAVQAKRQPGSAFKPFIYTAAIDNGFTAEDQILDAPVVFTGDDGKVWKPFNFEGKFFGPTTLRTALAHSRNVVTVKLLNKIGINTAVDYAKKMGIKSDLNRTLSLALGTGEVNLLELTDAYATLADQGIRVDPMPILSVKDSSGRELESHQPQTQEAIPAASAYIVTSMMKDVINHGTGFTIRQAGFTLPAAGKTGTTNDFSDAWFVGFTPDLVAGVWIGYDDRRPIGKFLTGGVVAAPIWADFMLKATAGQPGRDFQVPANVHFVNVCADSGQLYTPRCRREVSEAFLQGTEPVKACELHNREQNFEDLDSGGAKAAAKPEAPSGKQEGTEEDKGGF
jgi:penicillin-binding protein 1A